MFRILFVISLVWFVLPLATMAQVPDHLLISEVQIAGVTARDEFVELFNPTSTGIPVDGWKLVKHTSTGSASNLLSSSKFPNVIILPYTFFLIAHPDYQGGVTPDVSYSAASNSLASNNAVLLIDPNDVVVDLVGLGDASDFEGQATVNPADGQSIVRREIALPSGILAPAQDTDDNSADFILSDTPTPQNSDVALPVNLLASEAYWSPAGVVLTWRSEAQGILHWHIYRSKVGSGVERRITVEPIPVSDSGGYDYLDTSAIPGTVYTYVLETVDHSGAVNRSTVLTAIPSAVRLNTLATTWARLKQR